MYDDDLGQSAAAVSGADATTARRAAAVLPSAPPSRSKDSVDTRGERIATLVMGLGTFIVMPVVCFAWVGALPWGWLLVLAGLPAWLIVRWLFFRMRGSETGTFTVDEDGVIHVITGHLAVRRVMRLYDVGTRRWFGHVWISGLLMLVVGLGVPVTLAVSLDAPWIMLVWLTGACFGMLDCVLFVATRQFRLRSAQHRFLDGTAMLPALALHARHHGWHAAVSGVPADRLAATLAAHPAERAAAQRYVQNVAYMARLAALAGAGAGNGAMFE